MDAPRPLPANVRLALLPPEDAVKAFTDRKLLSPAYSWQDVWQEEHARAFTVAKLMRTDLLGAVYNAVGRALTEGRTLAQFEAELTPLLQREGWWGKRPVTDPRSGETRTVELGSPRRLALIYDVNLRQSYAAGRWARIERGRAVNPIVVYRTMRDERVRITHAPWDGVALPIDHPWWATHYPPNGWRCRCTAYATDAKTLARLKAAGVRIRDTAPPVETVEWVNRRTGSIERVPVGIDPGFAYNAGRVSRVGEAARREAEQLDALRRTIRAGAPVLTPAPAAPPAPPPAPDRPPGLPPWEAFRQPAAAEAALRERFGVDVYRGDVHRGHFGRKMPRAKELGLLNAIGAELTRLAGAGYGDIARGVGILNRSAGRNALGRAYVGAGGPGGRRLLAVNPEIPAARFGRLNEHGQPFTVDSKSPDEDRRAGVFRHELGHALTSALLKSRLARIVFADKQGNRLTAREWAERTVSEYSGKNNHELIAEAFARYLAPTYRKGEFPSDLEALLEDLARRRLD